jgi:hypothetical protein
MVLSMSTQSSSGIEVTSTFFVLAFILNLFKPVVTIDGVATKSAWRKPTFFATEPGAHSVQVHFPYLVLPTAGKAVTQVTVQPGQVVRVGYKAPWLVFLAGKLKVS